METIPLSQLEQSDTITITYQSRDDQKRTFTATVTNIQQSPQEAQIQLSNGATIYEPPLIVKTPAGETLPIHNITHKQN